MQASICGKIFWDLNQPVANYQHSLYGTLIMMDIPLFLIMFSSVVGVTPTLSNTKEIAPFVGELGLISIIENDRFNVKNSYTKFIKTMLIYYFGIKLTFVYRYRYQSDNRSCYTSVVSLLIGFEHLTSSILSLVIF